MVGFFHTGVRQVDESTAYVLTKTGQILAQQTGLINELRVRVNDPMAAREIAERIESDTGYKSVSWQEANEDLLVDLHHPQRHHVHGGRRDPAGGELRHLQHHLDHHAREDARHRHHEVARLERVHGAPIFVVEALIIGLVGALIGFGLGYLLCLGLGSIESRNPFIDATVCRSSTPCGTTCSPAWWR